MPAKIQLFYNKKKKKNKLFFILTDLLYIYFNNAPTTMHHKCPDSPFMNTTKITIS